MLFVHHDESRSGERREHRRARADHDVGAAVGGLQPTLQPLLVGQSRMEGDDPGLKSPRKAGNRLRSERNLGHQHKHLPASGEHVGDELQVNLGLAAARHPLEQTAAKAARAQPQGSQGCRLFGVQRQRGFELSGFSQGRFSGDLADQASSLQGGKQGARRFAQEGAALSTRQPLIPL